MAKEIEHKYLVINDSYKEMSRSCHHILQGYLSRDPNRIVRVRILDDCGIITIKGLTIGDTREEYEYKIPYNDAVEIMKLCEGNIIEKYRYIVPYAGWVWEVDCFKQPVEMTVAEIELPVSTKEYAIPPFIGEDVTGDPRYYNSNLSK